MTGTSAANAGAPVTHHQKGHGEGALYPGQAFCTSHLLVAALAHAARGLAVFPLLERSQAPACSRGFHNATTNPATIRRWWNGWHNYNIGIATGLISEAWVLDVDGSKGASALLDLELQHGSLPPTLCSVTAGGCHIWFRADSPISSSVGRIGPGLDVRADGGYVVAPPSTHPDGPTYRWTNDRAPAIAPPWLVRLAHQKPGAPRIILPEYRPTGSPGAYGRAALNRECEALASTPPGARNAALNRASFVLHQLVAGGELNCADVHRGLIQAATANGLTTDPTDGPLSVERTIASGARAGLQHPRRRRR
jgi:hypothetical protein